MSSGFAGVPGHTPPDRPTVPLTVTERETFERLTHQLGNQEHAGPVPAARYGGKRRLPIALAMMVISLVWMVAWLTTNVAVSSVGVPVLGVSMALSLSCREPSRVTGTAAASCART
jgi:hypothetical protein